jgi:phosphoenolpyruvate carboxykinase (GTP)
MRNNPALSPHADSPQGVPISAIVFGGRRASTVPLVLESFDWNHGVYLGATMGSETTAAATGKVGIVRRDPMAMLPFCGYNMGNYFAHWLEMQHKLKIPPKVFMVNWFRKDREGRFLWPGYGENIRVLKWIVERVNGRAAVEQSAVGMKPADGALDLTGIEIAPDALKEAMAVKPEDWTVELDSQEEFFKKIGASVPAQMDDQRKGLRAGLGIR